MGLLDRWKKRQEKKQLEQEKPAEKPAVVESVEKSTKTPAKVSKKTAVEEKTEKSVGKSKVSSIADRVLVRPLVTEKSAIAESNNKYGFMVARLATKSAVARAVAEAYGIVPIKVNLINVDGRRVRFGRSVGRRQDFKKAIVTLPKGKSISIHEGV